jgi:hypothetical protein
MEAIFSTAALPSLKIALNNKTSNGSTTAAKNNPAAESKIALLFICRS